MIIYMALNSTYTPVVAITMSCIHDVSHTLLDDLRSRRLPHGKTLQSIPFVKGNVDQIYTGGSDKQLLAQRPWSKDPHYFNKVYISSVALIKMAVHAKSGGSLEIMGMMTGKIVPSGIVVMDCYALPIEGTETRVNAQSEGYEFMVQYLESSKKTGREENIVGWYHSHPGYGCWLSGIDVATQALNQNFQDPYLAIVIDPLRGDTFGKIEIGCFRTYPPDYENKQGKRAMENKNEGPAPANDFLKQKKKKYHLSSTKSKDLGVHANRYYQIAIEVFKSSLDNDLLELMATKQSWDNLLRASQEVSEFNLSVQMDKIEELIYSIQSTPTELGYPVDYSRVLVERMRLSELFASAFYLILSRRLAGSPPVAAASSFASGGTLRYTPEVRSLEDLDMVDEEVDEKNRKTISHPPATRGTFNSSSGDDMVDDEGESEGYDGYLGNIDEVGGEDLEADTDVGTDAPEEDNGSTSDFDDDDANSMAEDQPVRVSMARRLLTRASRSASKVTTSRERAWAALRSAGPDSIRSGLKSSSASSLVGSRSSGSNTVSYFDTKDEGVSPNVYSMLEAHLAVQDPSTVTRKHATKTSQADDLVLQIAAKSLEELYYVYTQERLFR